MGGGGVGDFQFAGIFFFRSVLVQEFFFRLIPSARIFFFVVVFQKKKTLTKGFFKKVVLCGLGMITFNP